MTIYVNNKPLQTFNTAIALSIDKSWVLKDLATRKTRYSNQIKVPINSYNAGVLGYSPYQKQYTIKHPTYIVSNGIKVFSGYAYLIEVDNHFKIEILSDEINFFELIADKLVSELTNWEAPTAWNESVYASRRNISTLSKRDLVCPLINYGQIDHTNLKLTNVGFTLPSIRLAAVVNAIFEENGISFSMGSLESGILQPPTFYERMILPYSHHELSWITKAGSGGGITAADVVDETLTCKQILQFIQMFFCGKWEWVDYGLSFFSDAGFLFKQLKDTFNEKPTDWGRKFISSTETYRFGMAVNNYLKHKDAGTNTFAGNIISPNEDKEEEDIYASPFSIYGYTGSEQFYMDNTDPNPPIFYAATVPQAYMNNSGTVVIQTGDFIKPSIAVVRDALGLTFTEPAIEINGSMYSDYGVAHQRNNAGGNGIVFSSAVAENYARYKTSIGNLKYSTRQYILNEWDWLQVYGGQINIIEDKEGFWLIDKVDNWTPNGKTKVSCIKIW